MTVDVQNQRPEHEIELEKVGIEGLRKLVTLKHAKATYNVIVTINSYITLPANLRGVHMSRFVESVETPTSAATIEDLAELISKQALQKHGYNCQTEVFGELPYERMRPSGEKESSIAQMFAKFSTKTQRKTAGIQINGALACPCSKEMCNGLTHNQRGSLSVEIDTTKQKVQLLDIIEICSKSFSSPIFSLLKRSEEKKVVENMHENARFVEDVTRKCVQLLKEKYPETYCKVKCVSIESIHDHNVSSEWRGML